MASSLNGIHDVPVALGRTVDVLGENPVWDGRAQALYWVDIRARLCRRMDATTLQTQTIELPEISPGVVLTKDDRVVVAQRSHLTSVDFGEGSVRALDWPQPYLDSALRFNEMRADSLGQAWVGFMADAKTPGSGGLIRMNANGLSLEVANVTVPNGTCWSPDSRTMYFADSATGIMWAYEVDPKDGSLGSRREFVRIAAEQGVPDGATVDAMGHVWIAQYGAGRVVRYSPDGSAIQEVCVPVSQPTACTFGGPDLDVLFITTASQRLTDAQRQSEPSAGRLFAIRPGATGQEEPRLSLPSIISAVERPNMRTL